MGLGSTMLYRFQDGILVMMSTSKTPSDEEWTRHCQDLTRERPHLRGVLVYTAGGGPTSKQREQLRVAVGASLPPTAIMTDSAMVRGIITSINWFLNNPLTAFPHRDLEGALRHVASGGAVFDPAKVMGTLRMFAKELSVTLPDDWPDLSSKQLK